MSPAGAGPQDAERLAALHARAFERPWSAADIAALLRSVGAMAFATEAAFILVRALGPEAEVLTLAVAPEARRRGLGRALLESGLAAATKGGAEAMFLEVAADNKAALALYEGAGFEQVGSRRNYYPRAEEPAADALTLRRALSRGTG